MKENIKGNLDVEVKVYIIEDLNEDLNVEVKEIMKEGLNEDLDVKIRMRVEEKIVERLVIDLDEELDMELKAGWGNKVRRCEGEASESSPSHLITPLSTPAKVYTKLRVVAVLHLNIIVKDIATMLLQ